MLIEETGFSYKKILFIKTNSFLPKQIYSRINKNKRIMRRTSEMDKKASLEFHFLIVFTFVVFLIMIFFGIGAKLYSAFLGGASKDTLNNFDALTENIQLMIDKQSSFEAQTMIMYLENQHYVFGLVSPETLSDFNKDPADYPRKCKHKPCLCLYKKIKNFPAKPVKCKSFDDNVVFHGYGLGKNKIIESEQKLLGSLKFYGTEIPEQNPSLYSDYPEQAVLEYTPLVITPPTEDLAQDLYIEKFVSNTKTHIFITPFLKKEEIKQRASLLGSCPPNSDEKCIGMRRNAYISLTAKEYCYFDEATQRCLLKKGVESCVLGKRITHSCMCGHIYVEDYGKYCVQRFDNKLFVLPFNCSVIRTQCSDYCEAITATQDCDNDEAYYCRLDPCGVRSGDADRACRAVQENGRTRCEAVPVP